MVVVRKRRRNKNSKRRKEMRRYRWLRRRPSPRATHMVKYLYIRLPSTLICSKGKMKKYDYKSGTVPMSCIQYLRWYTRYPDRILLVKRFKAGVVFWHQDGKITKTDGGEKMDGGFLCINLPPHTPWRPPRPELLRNSLKINDSCYTRNVLYQYIFRSHLLPASICTPGILYTTLNSLRMD